MFFNLKWSINGVMRITALEWIVENAFTCKLSGKFFSDLELVAYYISPPFQDNAVHTHWESISWASFTWASCFLCLYYWFRKNHLVYIECLPKRECGNVWQGDREGYTITGIIKTFYLYWNVWFTLSYLNLTIYLRVTEIETIMSIL
jgi:hypothetical protein